MKSTENKTTENIITEKTMVVVDAEKISSLTGYRAEEVAIIKNTVAKGTTNSELAYFLSVCKSVGLNPFIKEIWCYKDYQNNLLVFAGRDGFLTIAQRNKRWNGMTSATVNENDVFEMDIPSGKIKHIIKQGNRGEVVGAYAIIKSKGTDMPTVEWADIKSYDKGYSTWKTNKSSMIQKVAETHALKKAFGISGLSSEYDFDVVNNIVKPIEEVTQTNELEQAKEKIIEALENYNGEDKDEIKKMCIEKTKANEFDMAFARNVAEQLELSL